MSSIPKLVSTVLATFESLEHLTETYVPAKAADVRSNLTRFKLWAGSIGAHRPYGHRSLEHRLSGASMIRGHVVTLLEDMCEHLQEARIVLRIDSQESENESKQDDELLSDYFADDEPDVDEFQEVLLQVKNDVNCLMRLAVTIRNPAPHEQFKSRLPALVSSFNASYSEHVLHKFPALNPEVTERLGKALTYRRLFLRYREEHHERLNEGIEIDRGVDQKTQKGESRGGVTTEASWLPKDNPENNKPRPRVWRDDMSEQTGTSYAPSCVDGAELRIPPIPPEYTDGPFLCPYCFLPIEIENRYQWKQHVFADLRPYSCLEPGCAHTEIGFGRRKDWFNHIVREHWQTWACPHGCAERLTTSSLFSEHMRQKHESASKPPETYLSSRDDLAQANGKCPLCLEYEIVSSHQYKSHVGHHLEQLALFVLPGAEEVEAETEDEQIVEDEIEEEEDEEEGIEQKQKQKCPHPDCGKMFKDLKAHMLTHQTERPEKCPITTCEYHTKGFARKYDQNRHILTHYKGTMVCGFCPGSGSAAEKSFNRADVFKRHLTAVHGVEQTPPNIRKNKNVTLESTGKPLGPGYAPDATGKCSLCSQTFSNAQDFYDHFNDCLVRIVHQEGDEMAQIGNLETDDEDESEEDYEREQDVRLGDSVKPKAPDEEANNAFNAQHSDEISGLPNTVLGSNRIWESNDELPSPLAESIAPPSMDEGVRMRAREATTEGQRDEVPEMVEESEEEVAKEERREVLRKIEQETNVKLAEEAKIAAGDDKEPIRFKDAVGRKFNFPWNLCATWSSMDVLIKQAFAHVEGTGPHVQAGHYDLIGPDGEIILPVVWDKTIQPGWQISMRMWPVEDHPLPPQPHAGNVGMSREQPMRQGDLMRQGHLQQRPLRAAKGPGGRRFPTAGHVLDAQPDQQMGNKSAKKPTR